MGVGETRRAPGDPHAAGGDHGDGICPQNRVLTAVLLLLRELDLEGLEAVQAAARRRLLMLRRPEMR